MLITQLDYLSFDWDSDLICRKRNNTKPKGQVSMEIIKQDI
jgi:hypothetical protein